MSLTGGTQANFTGNALYYGDNLKILRDYIPDKVIDLIYLDPPFKSNADYNLLFKEPTGESSRAQIIAFEDTWHWGIESEKTLKEIFDSKLATPKTKDLMNLLVGFLGKNDMMAYLVMMGIRLVELRRVLKDTGSIFLHCDPTASHYIKVIMDGVFSHQNFQGEIIWKRTTAHSDARGYGSIHDIILFYTKSNKFTWNKQLTKYSDKYLGTHYQYKEKDGRRYDTVAMHAAGGSSASRLFRGKELLPPPGTHWRFIQEKIDKMEEQGLLVYGGKDYPRYKKYYNKSSGVPLQDIWLDIPPINSGAEERLGYPTQKPIALLQRIIEASSSPNDVVFDPFCGCGTTIYAAHQLGRKWIGCDIAILSVRLVRDILLKKYGLEEGCGYLISGIPRSLEGAQELFAHDPRQFQHWSVELAGGFASAKFSGDKGIDGRIHFETRSGLKNMVLSVKCGSKPTPAWMRELHGVIQREDGTELGGLICMESPTKGTREEASSAGIYEYMGKSYDRLQVRTVQDLLDGKWFDTPSMVRTLGKSSQIIMPIKS